MKKLSGFSLLEILISMMMFMIVIASFAMVFPSGYHLNFKSYRENQGVALASAILHEIESKPFEPPIAGDNMMGDNIYNFQYGNSGHGWAGECSGGNGVCTCDGNSSANWTPRALCNFYQDNSGIATVYRYKLPEATGIQVTFVNPPDLGSTDDNGLAEVVVNLQRTEGNLNPIITLTTFASYNKQL